LGCRNGLDVGLSLTLPRWMSLVRLVVVGLRSARATAGL
jgi:hypothetical protein